MGSQAEKVGPCVALTIMLFMISFTFTVLVYLIQATEFELVLIVLWPVTSFFIVLTFLLYIYRSSNYLCVLEGHRIKIGRKSEILRQTKYCRKMERVNVIKENSWFHVKMKHPGKGVASDVFAGGDVFQYGNSICWDGNGQNIIIEHEWTIDGNKTRRKYGRRIKIKKRVQKYRAAKWKMKNFQAKKKRNFELRRNGSGK